MNAATETWDVFISYSTKDYAIIQKIVHDLQERGISYWLDEEQINPGDLILDAIEQGLRDSRAIMPCFSKNQLQSGWSRAEYSAILNQFLSRQTSQKIYPLLLDDVTEDQLPVLFRNIKSTNYGDTNNYKRLLDFLEKRINRGIQQQHDKEPLNELTFEHSTKQVQALGSTSVPENEQEAVRNLIPHFIHSQYQQKHVEGTFDALTMFVDVSGFTPMTQKLMKEGHEGAGILATVMNDIFNRLMETVYTWGGFISTFAGDAFTAIFPLHKEEAFERTVLHIFACIDGLQALFRRYAVQTTPYGQFVLQFKVGLSQGDVNWGITGQEQKTYYFRGEAIDGCAIAEHNADKGDIILDERFAQILITVPCIAEKVLEVSVVQPGFYRLHELPQEVLQGIKSPPLRYEPLNRDVLKYFLSDAVIHFKGIGEFRQIIPIFIAFEGEITFQELNDWTMVLLKHLKTFGGHFNHLDFGDKGNLVLCVFGAPFAYESMTDLALDFVLAVQQDLSNHASLSTMRWKAGITYGTAFTGIIGGTYRCEYTYYGEIVNLAARLMSSADWGDIFVSDAIYQRTLAVFSFESKGEQSYKGFAEPVTTYHLCGRRSTIDESSELETTMIGRRAELTQLQIFAAPIFEGKFAGITYIHGEAGIGKSRLASALQETLIRQHPIKWFRCRSDQIVRKPFNPFITLFMQYFDQISSEDKDVEKKKIFDKIFRALVRKCQKIPSDAARACVKELKRTKTVIGAQLGLSWRNSLWDDLDAEGKYNNTIAALKNFFLAHSLLAPVVIELEDGHWLDNDSREFLKILTHNITEYPIFIFATLRSHDDGSKITYQLQGIREAHVELHDLSEEDARRFAEVELHDRVSDELNAFLWEKTGGNPFFLQQLLRYTMEQNMLIFKNDAWQPVVKRFGVPAKIQEILAARIDRLPEETKDIVKAAAVIGSTFDLVVLSSVLNKDVFSQVEIIQEAKIWEAVPEFQYGFKFKHALLRDTAYEMQIESGRRELHRLIAERMEKFPTLHLKKYYTDIAYHYEHAKNKNKTIEYLEKAGDEAKAHYQNQQALDSYNRLLALLVLGRPTVKIDALLKKAEILEIIGKWKECQQICEEAIRLAEQIGDKRRMGQAKRISGIILRKEGQHDKAIASLKQAIEWFETVKDKKGIGLGFSSLGMVYWQRSDDVTAMAYYEKAFNIAEELDDKLEIAKNADNMGIIFYELRGNYEAAMIWFEKSLQIFEELENKLEKSRVLNNIGECHRTQGHYEAAMERYRETLQIAEKFGDKFQIATTLTNIGHVYKATGEYNMAIVNYDRAISMLKELGNKFVLCECLIGKADVLFVLQRYNDARALNAEGLSIAQESSRKNYTFLGTVLSSRIVFALGEGNAPRYLEDMLQQTQNTIEIATLHYELWKMTHRENHRQNALNLYQTLYEDTPNIDYKIRIDEMIQNLPGTRSKFCVLLIIKINYDQNMQ